jgi:hypothetical protein
MNRNIKIGDTVKAFGTQHKGWIIGEVVDIKDHFYSVSAADSDVPGAIGKTWSVWKVVFPSQRDYQNRITVI